MESAKMEIEKVKSENVTIRDFMHQIKFKTIAKDLIPMEMGMGWPMLSLRNNSLCITVPFYKAIRKPQDNTLIYPLAYAVTAIWPKGTVVAFNNLKFTPSFKNIDFSKPVGKFRHEALKSLNKEEYNQKVNELFLQYDKLIDCIKNNIPFEERDEQRFKENLKLLMEPSLKPFYMGLGHNFFQKFL